jgi:hypothetical protein
MEPPRRLSFAKLSADELRKHISFCGRALSDSGAAEISIGARHEIIVLWKRCYASRPSMLELQFSSGHLGRSAVERLNEAFIRKAVDCKQRLTPKERQISRLTTAHRADDPFTPSIVISLLNLAARSLETEGTLTYDIRYRGQFDAAYHLRPDDPLQPSRAYRAGRALGDAAGAMVRVLSRREPES